ncbi:MAG: DUF58 domain-containing protein, partial [Kurthia sp.]
MKSSIQRVTTSIVRLLLVVLLLSASLLFAIIQGGFTLWFIFFMLLPFVVYSIFLFLTPISNVTIERHLENGRLEQGQSATIQMTMKRSSFVPVLYMVVQELEPTGAFAQVDQQMLRKILPVGFKRTMTWYYKVDDLPRGRHELQGVQISIADFLGWVKKVHYIEAPNTLIVYPKIEPMHYHKMVSHEQGQLNASTKPQRQQSTMVSSIRDYNPGDRMSWIHWQSFAKTGDLHTKEFEQQKSEDACIVLDGLQGLHFEGQVSLAASLLSAVVAQHEKVSFLSASKKRKSFESIESQKELSEVLHHLAIIQPTVFEPTFVYAQDDLLRNSNAILFITSALTEGWIDLLARISMKKDSIIVYVIREANQQIFAEDVAIERHAAARGI